MNHRCSHRSHRLCLALTVAALVGCGSGPLVPTPPNVVGTYVATSLRQGTEDMIASWAASLTLTLLPSGSVSGSYYSMFEGIPVNMAGTYTVSGNNVTFIQSGRSWVRDATWTWNDGVLNGTYGSGTSVITARLERN